MPSPPVRTREAVERQVRQLFIGASHGLEADLWAEIGHRVAAALLAMAECDECSGTGEVTERGCSPQNIGMDPCPDCHGTGLDQARLQRGLNALEGR